MNYQTDLGLTFNYIDIQPTGTLLGTGDDASFTATLGGQPFYLYGIARTQLQIATDGYITSDLTDNGPDLSNDCPLPATPSTPAGTTGDRLYVCHDDKDVTMGIFHQYFPTSPYLHPSGQTMEANIIQWVGTHYGVGTVVNFQSIFFENGDVIYQVSMNAEDGSGSTSGAQSGDLSLFTNIVCNTVGTLGPGTVYGLSPSGNSLANSPCAPEPVEPIPTMSQWGLLIFGLLIMNLSVFYVQKRELI